MLLRRLTLPVGWFILASAILGLGLWAAADSRPSSDFHFAILGDRTGTPQPGIYGRVWREVSLLSPDFVINVGDTINAKTAAAAEKEWSELRTVWARYGNLPLFAVPGNHDIFSPETRRLYERATGRPATYSFDWQQAHFTVLDNSGGLQLGEDQLDFLERDLAKHRQRDPKFVFFHQPFWLIPLKLGSGEFRLHQLAVKYGVDYVVSGHGHQLLRLERDGIAYLEVGSSGAHLPVPPDVGFPQGRFYHFVWGRVKGVKVSLTVKELSPPAGKGRMFPVEQWGEPGPKFDPADPADKPET